MGNFLTHERDVRVIGRHGHLGAVGLLGRASPELATAQLDLPEERLVRLAVAPEVGFAVGAVQLLVAPLEIVVVLAGLVEGKVAGLFHHHGQRLHALRQADVIKLLAHALTAKGRPSTTVVVDTEGRLHCSYDNGGTRCGTNAGWRVETIKANAACGELVDVRRLDELLAVTTEPAADVLEINPENVGPFCRLHRQAA